MQKCPIPHPASPPPSLNHKELDSCQGKGIVPRPLFDTKKLHTGNRRCGAQIALGSDIVTHDDVPWRRLYIVCDFACKGLMHLSQPLVVRYKGVSRNSMDWSQTILNAMVLLHSGSACFRHVQSDVHKLCMHVQVVCIAAWHASLLNISSLCRVQVSMQRCSIYATCSTVSVL